MRFFHFAKGRQLTIGRLFREGAVALLGLLFFCVGLGYILDPDSIHRAVVPPFPYDYFMNSLYMLGGVVILVGFLDRRPGIESAGHTLLVPALCVAFATSLAEYGFANINSLLTLVFTLWSVLRAIGLVLRWQEKLQ